MSENIASVQCLHAIKPRLQAFSRTAEPQCAGYTGGREQLAALHSSSSGSFSSDMQGNSRMVSLNFIRVLTGTGTNGYGSWQRLRVAKDPYPYGPVPVGTRPPPDPAGPCGSGGPACGYGEAPYPHVPLMDPKLAAVHSSEVPLRCAKRTGGCPREVVRGRGRQENPTETRQFDYARHDACNATC
jgi:hypothetical protein